MVTVAEGGTSWRCCTASRYFRPRIFGLVDVVDGIAYRLEADINVSKHRARCQASSTIDPATCRSPRAQRRQFPAANDTNFLLSAALSNTPFGRCLPMSPSHDGVRGDGVPKPPLLKRSRSQLG